MNWFRSSSWMLVASLLASPGAVPAQQHESPRSGIAESFTHRPTDATLSDSSGPWIAFAGSTTNKLTGFVYAHSERAAELAAIAMCQERGGGECEVEFTLELGCAAVVSSADDSAWAVRPMYVEDAIYAARKSCGTDCSVVWSGCTTPRRRYR